MLFLALLKPTHMLQFTYIEITLVQREVAFYLLLIICSAFYNISVFLGPIMPSMRQI